MSPFLPSRDIPAPELRRLLNERYKTTGTPLDNDNLVVFDDVANGKIPMRVYHPQSHTLLPVLVFFHGGGFVFGNLDTTDGICRNIADATHSLVISVDYPLAPEHPFPAAPESCYEATCWIYDHLKHYQGDPNRFFISGSSAGANLAAVVALMIRDRGGPALAGQILLCPMTDTDFETPSYRENGEGYGLTRDYCQWFFTQYVPDQSQYRNPLVSPLRAESLKDLPPTLMVTAEFDPLRDEGLAYARRLQESGIPCESLCFKGVGHGFFVLPTDSVQTERNDLLKKLKAFLTER